MNQKKSRMGLVPYAILTALIILVGGVLTWAAIAIPELMRRKGQVAVTEEIKPKAETVVDPEVERRRLADDAEKDANRTNAHCKMLQRYYKGAETRVPMEELLGLPPTADRGDVGQRCHDLYASVEKMGSWPRGTPPEDNFIVCDGFEFALSGQFTLKLRPTRQLLANHQVLLALPGSDYVPFDVSNEMPVKVMQLLPRILQIDDRCVVVSVGRMGVGGKTLGLISRAAFEPGGGGGRIPLKDLPTLYEGGRKDAQGGQ